MDSKSDRHHIPGLSAREACADAIYRFLEGMDENDMAVLRSALHPSVVFDLSKETGKPTDVLQGPDVIIDKVSKGVGAMETLHQATNVRIWVDEKAGTAHGTASGLAQHKRTDEGKKVEADFCLQGNKYYFEFAKGAGGQDGNWVITLFRLTGSWIMGTTKIMPGGGGE